MSIRLWPQVFEKNEQISREERYLLRTASKNLKNGHFAVGIDPLGFSQSNMHMGMYISPTEGLVTFTILQGDLDVTGADSIKNSIEVMEKAIYARLLDSKLLISRNGNYKFLRFPYKHVLVFPTAKTSGTSFTDKEKKQLLNYITWGFFRPITSKGKEKKVSELGIFNGVRCEYDPNFKSISDEECKSIFERLAPEYTIVMSEKSPVVINTTNDITSTDFMITGDESEYKTFFLDEYQVSIVNEMGYGHRLVLANPGAGKSVILLSKAFKYASIYKADKVLLTCYNNNLADSYNFKKACANFGQNNNLYIMTFHKLVKKIYAEYLHTNTQEDIPSDEDIDICIRAIKNGKVKLRFKAIFIDEVQIFSPHYLELCYRLLDKEDEHCVFFLTGDLNQNIKKDVRRGDVPWKRMNDISLDFTGRVKYIEKNYRNSKQISQYIQSMLKLMNSRLSMLNMLNSLEYEYNSFKLGENSTVNLHIETGINRLSITNRIVASIKEISTKYGVSYNDIAILFPYRKMSYLKYYLLFWLRNELEKNDIPYSMIINSDEDPYAKTKYSETSGVILSTIESSLGLDFRAVILCGLYPYSYVFTGDKTKEIKSWSTIQNMSSNEQMIVQNQMRAIYTACSRARDVLYVLSDIKPRTPMEEIIKAKENEYGK